MTFYCNPINIPYRYQLIKQGNQVTASREAADPSIVLFKNTYYMFVSRSGGFYSSKDLVNWDFHLFDEVLPIYDYAPDVRIEGDYLYFSASKRNDVCHFYRTTDPIKNDWEVIEGSFPFWDPNLFFDDDKRVYLYWGCSNVTPIYGIELDGETLKPLQNEPVILIQSNTNKIGFERSGEDHIPPKTEEMIQTSIKSLLKQILGISDVNQLPEDKRMLIEKTAGNDPYIEGAWMTKHNGNYYLQYSAPGTQYNTYADGVYIGESPLGPFTFAKNNPYSYKPGGFINGAGHGSTVEDRNGNWWHASTMSISVNHDFERRVGIWQSGFDRDGQLYCDQRYGDWPVSLNQKPFEEPKMMLLSYGKKTSVSSGNHGERIVNENVRDWWQADKRDQAPWIELDLGKSYPVEGVQVNFADSGVRVDVPADTEFFGETMDKVVLEEADRQTKWILEGSEDGDAYQLIIDKSQAETDLPHDFIHFTEPQSYRFIRLKIIDVPFNQSICISGLRVFGKGVGKLPCKTALLKAEKTSAIDLELKWNKVEDAVGYNILWGYESDKLYHSYMVFDEFEKTIRALVADQEMYLRIDTFNENGITEGEVIKVD